MTHFLRDILRQPTELQRTIDFLMGVGRASLNAAAEVIRGARHVYLTGIGSSWHAALGAAPHFYLGGRPVYVEETAELLQFATLPPDSVVIVISRSGRSVEIVNFLTRFPSIPTPLWRPPPGFWRVSWFALGVSVSQLH